MYTVPVVLFCRFACLIFFLLPDQWWHYIRLSTRLQIIIICTRLHHVTYFHTSRLTLIFCCVFKYFDIQHLALQADPASFAQFARKCSSYQKLNQMTIRLLLCLHSQNLMTGRWQMDDNQMTIFSHKSVDGRHLRHLCVICLICTADHMRRWQYSRNWVTNTRTLGYALLYICYRLRTYRLLLVAVVSLDQV